MNDGSLSKCPSVMTFEQQSSIDDVIKQHRAPSSSVQRSVSLQPQRRPDRNNNSNNSPSSGGGVGTGSGHFELGNLLARAASLDAKFQQQLHDYETSERRLSTTTNNEGNHRYDDNDVWGRDTRGGLGRSSSCSVVHLPDRYLRAASVRRSSISSCSSWAGTVGGLRRASNSAPMTSSSYCGVPGGDVITNTASPAQALHTVLECSVVTSQLGEDDDDDDNDVTDKEAWHRRENDALLAMKWLRHEIRLLKQHDRSLMRTLFDLGTVIHQLNGGLQETVSCQTMNDCTPPSQQYNDQSVALTSALNWRPHVESDDCIQSTSAAHDIQAEQMTSSLDVNSRAMSMSEVRSSEACSSLNDSKSPAKTPTSRASRLFSRLRHSFRSVDKITE